MNHELCPCDITVVSSILGGITMFANALYQSISLKCTQPSRQKTKSQKSEPMTVVLAHDMFSLAVKYLQPPDNGYHNHSIAVFYHAIPSFF